MTDVDSQLRLAEDLARRGHVAHAVDACYRVNRQDDSEARTHALLANLFLSGDFFEQAIVSATRAIELDASCVPALLSLGLAYDSRGGMWDQSILVWHELAEAAPAVAITHVQLGEAFSEAGFEDEAVSAWHEALRHDSRQARATYDLAIASLKHEGMATALPGFRTAGELDAGQDDFFFLLAGMGDGPTAESLLAAPERDTHLASAYAAARGGDFFSAADMIRTILDEQPDDAETLALGGYLYLKQESANEAMAVALRALAVSTRTPSAVYVLGAAFAKRPGLGRNSARVFGALAKAVPDHPMPHVLLGESLLSLHRFRQAKESYAKAVELDPAFMRARFGLAAALLTEGEYSRAQWQIRRAAYHDTRRQGLFWPLYDDYVRGRG